VNFQSELEATSLLVYPRAGTDYADRIRRYVRYGVKQGRRQALERMGELLDELVENEILSGAFADSCVLVPIPGHAPLVKGGLWVARELCDVLREKGYGTGVVEALERTAAVPRSSVISTGEDRPSPERHAESLDAHHALELGSRVMLVDDVVTRGATFLGAARRLRKIIPAAEISGFAFFATGEDSIEGREEAVLPQRWCVGTDTASGRPIRRLC